MLHGVVKFFKEKTIHQKIAIACSIFISAVFLSIILLRTDNYPTATDDFTFYVRQLHKRFLNTSGFLNTIDYFFSPAFGIHTKLVGRFLGLFSYIFLGGINFKFLIIIGNLSYLFMGYKLSGIAANQSKDPYIAPIMLSILLVPLMTNFWTIFITAFPFHILFAFLCFYFMTKGKMKYMLLFFVLTAFNSGGGVFSGVVILLGLLLYSIREKKYILYALLVASLSGLILFFLFSFKAPATAKSEIILSFDALVSYSVYMMVFAQQAITSLFFNYNIIPLAYVIIGIFILGVLLYLFSYKYQETTHSPFFYLCLYILLLGIIAAVVRSGGKQIFSPVEGRYQHFSVIFMASFVTLVHSHIRSKYLKIGLGIFFALVFFMRFEQNNFSKRAGYFYDSLITKHGERLREMTRNEKYMPIYMPTYDDLSQNASLTPYTYEKKSKKPNTVKLIKFMDEPEFGLACFTFYPSVQYENVHVILKRKNRVFSLIPIKFKGDKHYALVAKNDDIPKGYYEVKIHYEVEDTVYEHALGEKMNITF